MHARLFSRNTISTPQKIAQGTLFKMGWDRVDPRNFTWIEIAVLCGVLLFALFVVFHFESLQYHLTHAFAKMGIADAQHAMAQRYMQGNNVLKNRTEAIEWFKKAAEQGHAPSAYNAALMHVKGHKTGLKRTPEIVGICGS
ncbi:secretory immunoglobulin A-binding protein EsiB-like isoform X2 [Ischnura elegans]|uniref:secretory immunoglobulin A-binding protein EsiB-like isoform X2 n=1 Tax=Ischnura elegans TaxID=197161 RepID=UPI001ED88E63|nr:secretory immunoglobulin A-binding protein EsiB-like isoform X2 [Ischnura elegans]